MLRRNKKPTPAAEPFTYVHRGTVVHGDLEARGRVRVDGTVHGDVRVEGLLEVAEHGVIEGREVHAEAVRIVGRVTANVVTRGKIEIWRQGELIGDVWAGALDIEEGATFSGRSEMQGAAEERPTSLPSARTSPSFELPEGDDAEERFGDGWVEPRLG